MKAARELLKSLSPADGQTLVPPALFTAFAALGTLGVLCCIAASALLGPASDPMFHFGENGAITALSSVTLAMTSILALVIFYLEKQDWDIGKMFWFVLAGGCLFLALDEQLQFHERGGSALELTSIGESGFFRNWNDLIVICYGLVALVIGALFRREILRCKAFAAFFGIGFLFYAIHTAVDSLLPISVAWKDIPEEGAKLLSVFSVFLGTCAMFMARAESFVRAGVREAKSLGHA